MRSKVPGSDLDPGQIGDERIFPDEENIEDLLEDAMEDAVAVKNGDSAEPASKPKSP